MTAVSIAVLAGAVAAACRREPARPDVLLVTIDTLRADHCSTYGYGPETTPVMTALAKSGVLFRHAYAPSATTAPSHASLLTGRHFRNLGVMKNGHGLAEPTETIGAVMARQGYATAGFVSSFPLRSKFGFHQGFEFFDDEFLEEHASIGRRNGGITHDRIAEATVRRFSAWLDQRTDPRPLFAWVHFVDPHYPYRAPDQFDGGWPATTPVMIRKYDGEVRYADRQLGRLVERFEKSARDDGALVIVTSDHGEGLGDHGWKSHGVNLYEEAVRIPLVARWSGHLPAGKVVEPPVSLVDVAPSILALIGLQPMTVDDGDDIFAKLDPDRRIFLQRRIFRTTEVRKKVVLGEMTAVVHRRSKYVTAPEENRHELYDLSADPFEMRNLLPQPDVVAAMTPAAPGPAADAAADATTAKRAAEAAEKGRRYQTELEQWRAATPVPDNETRLDRESLEALRALGYVD
ncbi:MAG TPA: sulfatase [Candidatus Binatia bacterium]|nr:sulfatase [Candidatus Binatia bacterium]